MKRSQRIAIFLIFVFAAVATPTTDPFTMIAMAVPMVLLYEGAVLFAIVHDKRKAKRKAAESETESLDDDVASTIDPLPERARGQPGRRLGRNHLMSELPGRPELADFSAAYDFPLDPFQLTACEALAGGYSVLVCAPTGSGKTVVGEFAVHLALTLGQKCFYTTPIKALSNQKFNDLCARYGADQVGLLTGDNSVNADAPVVVMTTEVLRNMLYVGSPALADLGYVVMDEVHYLGDRFRGGVWEEVIIHLSAAVRLISLSATVSNAEEFGEWPVSVRGETRVIVHEERPVPLWQHMLVGKRLFDLFVDTGDGQLGTTVDPALSRYVNDRMRVLDPSEYGRRGSARGIRWRPPHRPDVLERLDADGLLPAITFIFSRAGCDAAVSQCVQAGFWLTNEEERTKIDEIVAERTAGVAGEDLDVLGYWDWRDGLRRGVAAHHAGLVPVFKETVEELFVRGPGESRLRHRDTRAGHQHAGPHRCARTSVQVQR